MQDLKSFEPKEILLIWLGRLGDFVASTPFLDSMRERFPRSRIVLLTGRKGADVAALHPGADEIWPLEPWHRPHANAAVWARVASRGFGLAVDLNQSFSRGSGLLTLLSRAPVRASFQKKNGRLFYTHMADHDPLRDNIILSYGRLAALFGAPFRPRPRLELRPEHQNAASDILRGLGPDAKTAWLAVHAGNFKKFKNRWPEDKFIELTRRLSRPGLTIFYVAGPGEEKPVLEMLKSLPGALYLPPSSAPVAAAVLSRMDLLVANSTGTMHLAVAVGTPTFTLFSGYTSVVWSAPEGPHGGVVSPDWEDCRGTSVEEAYRTLLPTLEKALASPRPKTLE